MSHNPYGQAPSSPYAGKQNPYGGQAVAVQTATPAQLILMLYDGALTAIGRVRVAHGEGTIASTQVVNRELQRAQAIVNELQVCLDHDRGNPLAGYFAALYDFCQHELLTANIGKVIDRLGDVEVVLTELRDAWNTACVLGNPQVPTGTSADQPAMAV